MTIEKIVFYNGLFIKESEVKISPNDRGFIFADGVYEVIRSYNGFLFCSKEHIERLARSLKELWIEYEKIDEILSIVKQLLSKNNLDTSSAKVYIQITRGAEARNHKISSIPIEPTIFISADYFNPDIKKMEEGISTVTVSDNRWSRCDIKSISLLANVMARQQATKNNADEAVFIKNGVITEGSHSNIFAVKNNIIYTYPQCNLILPGITRNVVVKLIRDLEYKCVFQPISEYEIFELDELFMTCTSDEISPIVKVNDKKIGKGVPGKLTVKLQNAFNHYVVKMQNELLGQN